MSDVEAEAAQVIGSDLTVDPAERTAVARLNLAAGRRAKNSAAYGAACDYLDAGIALLPAEPWRVDYPLAFELSLEAAECPYLAGAFEQAERELGRLLENARTPLDQGRVHTLRVTLYENLSRWVEAVSSGREGLALFGIVFPDEPGGKQAALDGEVDAIRLALGGRPIASLIDLPPMTDATMRLVMRLLTILWAPAYVSGDQVLARLISASGAPSCPRGRRGPPGGSPSART